MPLVVGGASCPLAGQQNPALADGAVSMTPLSRVVKKNLKFLAHPWISSFALHAAASAQARWSSSILMW
jgi:hypothetical protein